MIPRHLEGLTDRCFLPDLAGLISFYCTGSSPSKKESAQTDGNSIMLPIGNQRIFQTLLLLSYRKAVIKRVSQ